jgi:DNA-directed RNA polymerase subunit RPC12/RpoP
MSTTPNDDDEWFSLEPIEPKKESPKKDPPKTKPVDPKDTPRSVFDDDLPDLAPLPAPQPAPKSAPKSAPKTTPKPPPTSSSAPSSSGAPKAQEPPANKPPASKPPASKPADREYSITCQVCKSILSVQALQVGKQIRCPDCHSMVKVPPPPIKKPVQSTPIDQLASVDLAPVEATNPRTASGASVNTKAMLNKASKEIERERDEIEAVSSPFDSKEWLSRTFGFLSDSRLVLSLVLLGLATALCFYIGSTYGDLLVTHNANRVVRRVTRTIATTPEQTSTMLYRLVTGLVNLLITLPIIATFILAVAIIPKAANRLKRIDPWPLMGHLRQYAAPAGVAAAVWYLAHLIGHTLSMPLAILKMPVSIQEAFAEFVPWLILPVVYLSMLESQSHQRPFSQSIYRSIAAKPDAWGAMYMQTGIGFVLYFVCTQIGILQGTAFFAVAGFFFPWFICFLANQYGVLAGRLSDVTELGYEGDFSERE